MSHHPRVRASEKPNATVTPVTAQSTEPEASRRDILATLLGVAAGGSVMSGCIGKAGIEDAERTATVSDPVVSGWYGGEVATYADLRAQNGSNGTENYDVAFCQGRSALNDGGQGWFFWVSGDTAADDDATIIRPTSSPSGNWHRIVDGEISVKWFGARGNNQGDDTAAINRAIAFANALSSAFTGITIFFPAGTYIISAGLTTISAHYVHVRGAGANATQINLAPTADTYVFVFCGMGSPSTVQVLCSISGLGFYSADTTYHKTAILCINASDMVIEDIVVSPPWTGNTSIGLRTQGREAVRARNLTISADRPISIERNPGAGTLGGNTIDCDHFHFSDLYLLPSSTECCIAFVGDSTHGINLTDFTLDGYNAFVGGENGVFFSDPPGNTVVSTCLSFHVQNVRREQTASGGTGAGNNGFAIYINAVNRRFQNILIQNVHADNTAKGFFFRSANNVTLQNCIYDGSSSFNSHPTALDADSSCWDIALQNTMFQVGSTINTSGLQEVLSLEKYGTQISPFVYFTTTSDSALPGIKLGGAVRIVTGSGAPTSSEPSGSLYLNQTGGTGNPPTAWLYVREGSSWIAK